MELHWLLPIVLVTARLFGAIGQRVGIPAVVGEILAGVLLGPSVMGVLAFSHEGEGSRLLDLAQIGLCVLLFKVGLETDLASARRGARSAALLGVSGMLFPLALGTLVASLYGVPVLAAAFVGATLTATSIGITAATLDEIGASGDSRAPVLFGAAVVDDVLGLVLLAAMIGSTSNDSTTAAHVLRAIGQALGFLGAAWLLGPPVSRATVWLTRWTGTRSTLLVLVFSVLLLTAWASKSAGLEMIVGAYAAGLALARHPERTWLHAELEPVIELFTPIFFVLVGSAVALEHLNLGTASGRSALGLAGLLLVTAVMGKILAPFPFSAFSGSRLAIGSALVPRGEVGLIFAQVGLTAGVLTPDRFAALTLVIAATTLIGPLLVRRLWKRVTP